MSSAHIGRHYLQITDEIVDAILFSALKSPRRMKMAEATGNKSYQLEGQALSSLGVNYLQQLPELDEYKVEAADGDFIPHACHTEKNSQGNVFAAGFIFFHARITHICSITIRSLQNAIMMRRSIMALMDSLARHLKPGVTEIAEY
ncbi:MAG: hypothetical protein ACJATV_000592 [Granulosicoccus sp.]|jgi:hypothetical protein